MAGIEADNNQWRIGLSGSQQHLGDRGGHRTHQYPVHPHRPRSAPTADSSRSKLQAPAEAVIELVTPGG